MGEWTWVLGTLNSGLWTLTSVSSRLTVWPFVGTGESRAKRPTTFSISFFSFFICFLIVLKPKAPQSHYFGKVELELRSPRCPCYLLVRHPPPSGFRFRKRKEQGAGHPSLPRATEPEMRQSDFLEPGTIVLRTCTCTCTCTCLYLYQKSVRCILKDVSVANFYVL